MASGNDFKRPGARVKGDLPHDFEEKFKTKLSQICQSAETTTFVLWGDWRAWKGGFTGGQTAEDGARFDSFCAKTVQIASTVCDKVIWLSGEELEKMPKRDGWHFDASAKQSLQDILRRLTIFIKPEANTPPEEKAQKAPESANNEPEKGNKNPRKTAESANHEEHHAKYFLCEDQSAKSLPRVLCLGCMSWRKPSGFLTHLESCIPAEEVAGRKKATSFAYGQLKDLKLTVDIYEKKFGPLPDYVVADCPRQFRSTLVAGKYGNPL